MQDKVIEIIVFILSEIKEIKQLNEISFESLAGRGYSESEINTAFAWIYSKLDDGELVFREEESVSESHRLFNSVEEKIFTTDAKGYLLLMRELGLLNDLDIDLVIEKALLSGYRIINLGDLKKFIASIVLNMDNKSDILNRMILQNNDTIN